MVEECEFTKRGNKSWRELLRKGRENISSINNIIWKRKDTERKNKPKTD